MSRALDVLQMKEEDVLEYLAAGTHLGGTDLDFQVEQYIYKRKSYAIYIINLKRAWEKLLLAAHAIVAIENPAHVSVTSSRNTSQRAVLKFAAATGATPIAGRFTLGTFTNQIQAAFWEPYFWWLLIPGPTTSLSQRAKKEGIAVKTSKSSKISINESKTASPCTLETESMLLNVEKSSEPSSPEKTSTLSSTEKLIKPSSPEMPSRPSSTEKLIRPSSQEMPSSHLEKSHRTCSLEKSHKLTCSHKLVNQVSSSYSNMAVKSPWPASLQYPVKPTESSCPPCPHNQILVPTSSSLQKFGTRMSFGHSNIKTLVSVGRAEVLSSPQSVKSCQCYQEKCLMCKTTSKSLSNDISKPKKTNAQNPPFLCEMKPFSKSFHRVDSRDNVVYGNASDSDKITYDSEDDSDREIIIICNRKPNEGTPNN
ncbi:40S ribosomal protein SA [Pteropus alecto]|uniref:40S ribosomal protein SA n=1 Tax=Pteropus alecto TaxID=9402 RepID=L5JT95_PTEAL|nr:40S ribosomal protein SA [Pteropus alecto]